MNTLRTARASPLVEIEDVSKEYVISQGILARSAKRIVAVEGVSFSIKEGTTFGLVGESGSGKSTIAKMLLKLERPSGGKVLVGGDDINAQQPSEERAYRREVQAVLQDPYGALSPRMRVGSIVAEPLRAQGVDKQEAAQTADRLLNLVGIAPSATTRFPHEFSGGQRQRIAIARALTVNPRLVVLDEPVSALDVSVRAQVLALLRELQGENGLTYLFIGHDLAVVRYLSHSVGVMYFGRLVEIGGSAQVFRNPRHPYTRRLVSIASGDSLLGSLRMGGELPNPLAPPSGCTFRTRCEFADGLCKAQVPPLVSVDDNQKAACHHHEQIASGTKAQTGPVLD